MTRIGIVIYLILLLMVKIGVAQESYIFRGSFEDCKKKALHENKLILVDLYFEGCVPCKMMDEKVFPSTEVDAELKANFVLYKTDVFKEEDGMKLSRKYGVSGFPTYLIMNPSGKVIYIESGYFAVDRFMDLLHEGKKRSAENKLLAFDTDLEKHYPSYFTYRYFRKGDKGEPLDLKNYIKDKNLKEETAFVVSSLVNNNDVDSWTYNNLPWLLDNYGSSLLRKKVIKRMDSKMIAYGKAQQLDSLNTTLAYIKPVFNAQLWKTFLPQFITDYYKGSQDADLYLSYMDSYQLYPSWPLRSNALAQVIIDQKDNKSVLKKIRQQYLDQEKQGDLDITDRYKLTLLHFYLADYVNAAKGVEILKLLTNNTKERTITPSELNLLSAAITQKKPNIYLPQLAVRTIGSSFE